MTRSIPAKNSVLSMIPATGTVGATEPPGEFFDLAPVAQDFVAWKVARDVV